MIRILTFLLLLGLVLGVACSVATLPQTNISIATSTPSEQIDLISSQIIAPTSPAIPSPAVRPSPTPTLPRSPCAPPVTPQPTPTTGPNNPAPAFRGGEAVFPRATGRSDLIDGKFYSALLGQQMPILIYLPPGYYDSSRRYPVLYMLSGFAGDYHEWNNWGMCDALESLIRSGIIQPMIVVLPEGGHSWWFNHAQATGSDGKPWGDYIWKDVVGYVDSTYRTITRRESRAIGGLSAGGQSSLMLALTHPELFSIAGAHSPSIRHADGSLAFFGDEEYFQQYDPIWLFQNTQTWRQIVFWIDVGNNDHQWGESIHDLHNMLSALGVPHDFEDSWTGIHDDYYWGAHIPDYLIWYSAQLSGE